MIFFFNERGYSIQEYPEDIYQGSVGKTIYFVAPFSVATNTIGVAFTLPNGKRTAMDMLTPLNGSLPLTGVQAPSGKTFAIWQYTMPAILTDYAGIVQVQFFINSVTGTYITDTLATSTVSFSVLDGVPPVEPSEQTLQGIIDLITNMWLQAERQVKAFGSKAQFPKIGQENVIYIDNEENALYRWSDADLRYYCVGRNYEEIDIINGGNLNGN